MLFQNCEILPDDVDSDLFFAFIVSGLNLTPKKLEYIKSFYEQDWLDAINDNFEKVDNKKLGFVKKWRGYNKTKIAKNLIIFKNSLENNNIKILPYTNSQYPKNLLKLEDYPLVLYYQGSIECLNKVSTMLTVVGSRLYTKYSEVVMNKILGQACVKGVGVVSGLALGVDGISHRIALENNANTIGVIGGGLDRASFYPKNNWNIAQNIIASKGLLVSEYPPGTKPQKWNFPARNRILAALTNLTWVVQAGLKSGTLITAKQALDVGSDVVTTPASIFESSTAGNIWLLKNGAGVVSSEQDIIDLLGLKGKDLVHSSDAKVKLRVEIEDNLQAKVFKLLKENKGIAVDFLAKELAVEVIEINSALTMLELESLVESLGDNIWIKRV